MMIACGAVHSVALADTGHIYTWGTGPSGELGCANLQGLPPLSHEHTDAI